MKSRLVQITAGAARGDAVTNYVRFLDEGLAASGEFSSTRIYAENIAEDCPGRIRHICLYTPRPRDVIVYHHSVGLRYLSSVLFPHVRPLLIYHNITPASYYTEWDLRAAGRMVLGRSQLRMLAGVCDHSVALSNFSAEELRRAGFSDVHVLPYPVEAALRPRPEDPGGPRKTGHEPGVQPGESQVHRVLFVGRIAPNKRVEWLLEVFHSLRKQMEASGHRVRLVVAGASRNDRYYASVRQLCSAMGLDAHVEWTGYLDDDALRRHWGQASLYVSMSEHEGFGVPFLEAMAWNVPILAFCSSGSSVAEVLNGAGVGFTTGSPVSIAGLARRILLDSHYRAKVLLGQKSRLAEIARENVASGILQIIRGMSRAR